ncbi:hypothetical protein [Clostridium sp. CF012]|uniref:hypothetical protein n=1 Tax=Clostridium sp. CF012 TaxID=2843319 RepID=UPI001C0D62CF|nr:hypothetical protein [Clostridium sp. CF012]MBU3145034.1 hypothetical protein [Clostridium sp. CF012]
MKKGVLIVIVIVVTSVAIIFSKNIKAKVQAENLSLNENVYSFLEDKGNRIDAYNSAIKLNQGSSENTCVYFISEVLRRNNFDVPAQTSNTSQIISLLKEKGFKKRSDYENLKPGDICFTTDDNGGFPTHTYIFMKWVKEGNYDYAYICDNQAKDYKGKIYHIRNINVVTKSNGFNKDAFAFFMKRN